MQGIRAPGDTPLTKTMLRSHLLGAWEELPYEDAKTETMVKNNTID